jgi:hypothetical protein
MWASLVGVLELPGLAVGWLVSACPPLLPLVLLGTKKGSPAHLHSSKDTLLDVLEHFYLIDTPCFREARLGREQLEHLFDLGLKKPAVEGGYYLPQTYYVRSDTTLDHSQKVSI